MTSKTASDRPAILDTMPAPVQAAYDAAAAHPTPKGSQMTPAVIAAIAMFE